MDDEESKKDETQNENPSPKNERATQNRVMLRHLPVCFRHEGFRHEGFRGGWKESSGKYLDLYKIYINNLVHCFLLFHLTFSLLV